jgi:nucleolin
VKATNGHGATNGKKVK